MPEVKKICANFFLRIRKTIFGPVLGYILYYFDLITDFWNMGTKFKNCHPNYGALSIMIIISSYLSTVLYLYKSGIGIKESGDLLNWVFSPIQCSKSLWRKLKRICSGEKAEETKEEKKYGFKKLEHQKLLLAFMYPFQHSKNLWEQLKRIWKDEEPEETEEEKIYGHCISFFEATTESLLQLCLTCIILREYGLSNNAFDKFMQVLGLFTSFFSICFAFAKV